jgi:hypothetical protein
MSDADKYRGMIDQALAPLGQEKAGEISLMVWALFEIVYPDLLKTIDGNPIEHHPVVLGHMIEIAKGEMSPYIVPIQAAALALLHDISPVERITTQMVRKAREEDPAKGAALELKRQQNRILHMREGSAMAHRRMLATNDLLSGVAFDAETIDIVCEAIRIHDNPSLDIPIPRGNWLAVAFRESDRLWMITHDGILADLKRKDKRADDLAAYGAQLDWNLDRFCEERSLYRPLEPTEGPFCDDETFFRTKTGYALYRRLRGEAEKRAGTCSCPSA